MSRGVVVRLLAGLALAIVLGAAAVWALRREAAPGTGATYGLPPAVPLAIDKSLGVTADLSGYDPARRQEALALMRASGLRWLRQRFPWDAIEPQPGRYDWAVWDQIVDEVSRHNLMLIAVLDGSPAWARAAEDADNPLAPPHETRDFGAFAAALAARYGDRIDYYQVWDEPNIAPHWGAREVSPAAYARLLREAAIQLRAADPGATVLLAALAPNVEPGGANMADTLYLDALYRWGAAEWFDVVAAQPYDFGQPLDARPDPARLNWSRIALVRAVMEAHGDEGAAVWAVSWGLADVTPERAAQVWRQSREDWPWLGPMLWAAWSPADSHGQYALTDSRGRPTPSLDHLTALADRPPIAWPGVYPADHDSGRYTGGWRVTPLGADIGGSGDRLTISFHGTRLDLTVRRGDYRAFLFVTVDGQPANALPHDSAGEAYLVLYDPLRQEATVPLARGLPDGDHVAEVRAERGWGQWAIVGWTVSREAPRRLPWLPLVLGLASAVILAITTWGFCSSSLFSPLFSLLSPLFSLDDRLALLLTAAAVALLAAMQGPVLSLMAVGLLALLLLLRPDTGLPLIVLVLPFYQVGKPLLGKVFSLVEILTLLTAVGWAVWWVLGNRVAGNRDSRNQEPGSERHAARNTLCALRITHYISRLTHLDRGVLALIAIGALSLLWAEHVREAAREFRTVVLEAGIFYGLLRAMVRSRREAWRLADAWLLGGVAIAVVGIGQWLFGQNLITAEGVWRVRGYYGSPNNLALYLGRLFPLAVAVSAWGRGGKRRRWLYGLAALLMAVVLFLTYSRGAWLVGVPAALLFLAAMRGWRSLALAVGLLLLVALLGILAVGPGRLTSLLDITEGTTFFRLQLWQSSLAMIRDHPLLGVGLDNFLYAYRTRYVLPTAWEEFDLSHPHNLLLDFWLRLGLAGLALLVWLLAAFFRPGLRAYRRLPEGSDRLLVLGLMGGMVNFVAHGLVDNAFFLVDLAFVFMLMLVLVPVTNDE